MTDDLAQQVLQEIAKAWLVDDDRIRWLDADKEGSPGFEWWPGDFCVTVRAHRHVDLATDARVRIQIHTDLLRDVTLESKEFQKRMELLKGAWTPTYALVYLPKPAFDLAKDPTLPRKLYLSSTGYISSQNAGWMTFTLANATLLQPINAQWLARAAAELLDTGTPDETRPHALRDAPLDDILGVIADVYAPMGEAPSRFAGTGEFEEFAETWGRQDVCFGTGDPTGLTLETPFGQDTAIIRFRTDEKHPQLGHGLLATLRLPYGGDQFWAVTEAAGLNLLESGMWTGIPLLGCWHIWEERDEYVPAFSLFMPNALYMQGLVTNIALWFIARAQWVRKKKFPDVSDAPMYEILERRMAQWRK